MKIKWLNFCKWALGFLGISAFIASCDGVRYMEAEYGQPHIRYKVKGKVVDAQTGEGVPGIGVSPMDYYQVQQITENDGSFAFAGEMWPKDKLPLEIQDTDPEKDGNYKSSTDTVQLKKVKDGSGNWYKGEFEALDVVLKVEKLEEK